VPLTTTDGADYNVLQSQHLMMLSLDKDSLYGLVGPMRGRATGLLMTRETP